MDNNAEFIPDTDFFLKVQEIHQIHKSAKCNETPEQLVRCELLNDICMNEVVSTFSIEPQYSDSGYIKKLTKEEYILRLKAEIERLGGRWEFETYYMYSYSQDEINPETGEIVKDGNIIVCSGEMDNLRCEKLEFKNLVVSWPYLKKWVKVSQPEVMTE